MKKREWKNEYTEFDSEKELNEVDAVLLAKAKEISATAYAPYSGFRVGAAVLLKNGETVTGSNQENAAYPSGLCAERVAVFSAASRFPQTAVTAIAITCTSAGGGVKDPVTPCGACRQVISEYEQLYGSNIRLVLAGEKGKVWVFDSMKQLLPFAFNGKSL